MSALREFVKSVVGMAPESWKIEAKEAAWQREREAEKAKKAAPQYKKMGLADFLVSDRSGFHLWNFPDGSAALDANHQRALKSTFLVTVSNAENKYEIVGIC